MVNPEISMTDKLMLAVVDDDSSIVETLKMLLSTRGWQVSSHGCAESLLGALIPCQKRLMIKDDEGKLCYLQAVVADYNLPGISGVELAHRLMKFSPHLHIIMMTGAHDELELVLKRRFPGVVSLSKPFSIRDLEVALLISRPT
ncbi:MAG: response regulator [Limnohabitans sp.]|uniref:response regulator n=1 Tax=Limnohabitans sp. TaxID=1907725 RepID=UPI003BB10B78